MWLDLIPVSVKSLFSVRFLCATATVVSVSVRHSATDSARAGGKMVRVLNVAEKNDAAKSLSDIMSGGRYRKVSSQ